MTLLSFRPDDLAVRHEGRTITLLPKEFALLQFLYDNQGHTFTREELLNRVWPLEDPVDRTVDDHIYRLRKKLKHWDDRLTLDTIRNRGYRLTLKAPKPTENPSLRDPEFGAHVQEIFSKYHLYGQGAAMQTLAEQQQLLGLQIDPFYQTYTRFIAGDFRWLLEADEVPFSEKAYLLDVMLYNFNDDTEESVLFLEKLLVSEYLSDEQRWELDRLDRVFIYMLAGRIDDAVATIDKTREIVLERGMHGFHIAVLNTSIGVYMLAGRLEEAAHWIAEVERLLVEAPYLRERATFYTYYGLYLLYHGDKRAAKQRIAEGIEIYRQSRFIPQYLHTLHHILLFLERFAPDTELEATYRKQWNEASRHYDFPFLEKKIRELLQTHLL